MDSDGDTLTGGLPHSEIPGSTIARISPGLIAACHALHRLSVPRHPPDALKTLDPGYGVSHIRQNPPLTGTKTTPRATLLHEDTLPHKADEQLSAVSHQLSAKNRDTRLGHTLFTCQRTHQQCRRIAGKLETSTIAALTLVSAKRRQSRATP